MFLVIEIQKGDSIANIVTTYDTINEAENKYHTILASAAVSAVPKHSAVMLDENGDFIKSECFEHE